MFAASAILVFGAVALFSAAMLMSDSGALAPGYAWMMRGGLPWPLIAPLIVGTALGVVSLRGVRSAARIGTVGVEAVATGLLLYLFTSMSVLPAHQLNIATGDSFPAYSLTAQDGSVRSFTPGTVGPPSLYVFYRGGW